MNKTAFCWKLGIDATKKLRGGEFKRPRPPLIKMDAVVETTVGKLFNSQETTSGDSDIVLIWPLQAANGEEKCVS